MSSENSADSTTMSSEALKKKHTQRQRSLDISLGKEESLEKEESQNADVNSWRV